MKWQIKFHLKYMAILLVVGGGVTLAVFLIPALRPYYTLIFGLSGGLMGAGFVQGIEALREFFKRD